MSKFIEGGPQDGAPKPTFQHPDELMKWLERQPEPTPGDIAEFMGGVEELVMMRRKRAFPLVLDEAFWEPLTSLPPEAKKRFLDTLMSNDSPDESGPSISKPE